MENPEEKKYLADVINYNRDIEPYQIIQLYAGVGSGKNTFIEKLIKGEIENSPKGLKVLLITSRRAKVDETLGQKNKKAGKKKKDKKEELPRLISYGGKESLALFCEHIGLQGNVFFHEWYEEERESFKDNLFIIPDKEGREHNIYQQSVICTNALIAAYFRYCYDAQNVNTWLWEKFDLIVIDEAHSLFMDASYQEAPFHVNEMLIHYMKLCAMANADSENNRMPNCKHMILMTGTPMLLLEYLKDICPENVRMNTIDVRETCKNVVPQEVQFIEQKFVKNRLTEMVEDGKRIIYFSSSTQTVDEFCNRYKLPKEKVITSFSDKKKRNNLKKDKPEVFKAMEKTEAEIRDHFKIPPEYNVFVTTSRYKEGINLYDDIDYMFVETHVSSDAIQMAGRVRNGIKTLYIITDRKPNKSEIPHLKLEWTAAKALCSDKYDIKETYEYDIKDTDDNGPEKYESFSDALIMENFAAIAPKIVEGEEAEEKKLSQSEILKKYELRFFDFMESKFPVLRYSYIEEKFKLYGLKIENNIYSKIEEEKWQDIIKKGTFEEMGEWFPGAKIEAVDDLRRTAWKYCDENGIKIGAEFTKEEWDKHIEFLASLYNMNPKRPNAILKIFNKNLYYKAYGHGKKKCHIIERPEEATLAGNDESQG